MKTVKRSITGITAALAMWAVGGARAGDLTPPSAPGSTMHTLEEIYQRQATLEANQSSMEARLQSAGYISVVDGMVLIPAGDFVMGDTFGEGDDDELPLHTNTISAFYMDIYEVSKANWDEVYNWATNSGYAFDNAGSGKATNHPVHTVNWYDCLKWANAKSQRDGFTPCYTNASGTVYSNGIFSGGCNWSADGYRLPTEAEWEKAARGGVAGTRFPWSPVKTIQHARANYFSSPSTYSYDTSAMGGYHPSYNTGGQPYTSPVGSFAPNGYGLYDMAGNLLEWCWDRYDSGYYAMSPGTDPRGPASGSSRVERDSFWGGYGRYCRVASREYDSPDVESMSLGFRLVRAAQ